MNVLAIAFAVVSIISTVYLCSRKSLKKARKALSIFASLVVVTALVAANVFGVFAASATTSAPAVFAEEIEEKLSAPQDFGSKDDESPATAEDLNKIIPQVANTEGKISLENFRDGIRSPGSSVGQFMWEKSEIPQQVGYTSLEEFYHYLDLQVEIAKVSGRCFISAIAFGYEPDEPVSLQALINEASRLGIPLEAATGYVDKPQGDIALNSGNPVTGQNINDAGYRNVATFETEIVGKSINFQYNFYPKETLIEMAKQYGVSYTEYKSPSLPFGTIFAGINAYAEEQDESVRWTSTISQAGMSAGDHLLNIRVNSKETGKKLSEESVVVSKEEFDKYSTPVTVEGEVYTALGGKFKTVLGPCSNPGSGMRTKEPSAPETPTTSQSTTPSTGSSTSTTNTTSTTETSSSSSTTETSTSTSDSSSSSSSESSSTDSSSSSSTSETLAPKVPESQESGTPSSVSNKGELETTMSTTNNTTPIKPEDTSSEKPKDPTHESLAKDPNVGTVENNGNSDANNGAGSYPGAKAYILNKEDVNEVSDLSEATDTSSTYVEKESTAVSVVSNVGMVILSGINVAAAVIVRFKII